MIKPLSYSHSRLETFEKCPKQFWHMNVIKDVPYIESDQMRQGKVVHKMFEDRVSKGAPFPTDYAAKFEPIAQAIIRRPGKKFTEMQLAYSWDRKPCGYREWDKVACRIIVDVAIIDGRTAWLGDYKTGKRSFDEAQLKLSSLGGFLHWPDVDTIATAYIWTQHIGTKLALDARTYTRDDIPAIWAEVEPKVDRLQEANRTGNWPARANKFCAWCAVNAKGKCAEAGAPPRRT